jgi:ribosomal protein S27AE
MRGLAPSCLRSPSNSCWKKRADAFILAFRFVRPQRQVLAYLLSTGLFAAWEAFTEMGRARINCLKTRGVSEMELKCQKCGASVTADQAFCPRCGAVVGMSNAPQESGGEWDMAATMVGKQLPVTPPRPAPRPSVAAAPQPARPNVQAPAPVAPVQQSAGSSSNTVLLAVIGFVAVLLIGGLLILLFYLNSQG